MKSVPNPLGGERRSYQWRGLSVAYVVRGAGAPVVFLHSIHAAAWSAEWRHVFPALADGAASDPPGGFCCYALDLPGFGASDRPPLRYTALTLEQAEAAMEARERGGAAAAAAALGASSRLAAAVGRARGSKASSAATRSTASRGTPPPSAASRAARGLAGGRTAAPHGRAVRPIEATALTIARSTAAPSVTSSWAS